MVKLQIAISDTRLKGAPIDANDFFTPSWKLMKARLVKAHLAKEEATPSLK